MVGQNGYFVNPEAAGRSARPHRDGEACGGQLSDRVALAKGEVRDSWRIGQANSTGRSR